MGCHFSKKEKPQSKFVRVVHFNGFVEDFYYPLTAGEVTGTPPKQFLCTQSQLMSGYLKPLKPDTRLEPSHVYFMLAYSTIQSESSPMDIATTAKRLIKLAKASGSLANSTPSNGCSPRGGSSASESPARSPSLLAGKSSIHEFGKVGSCKVPGSWKPILDTIRESSFNRRSESDLREIHLEMII